jgi:predicted nucleotidyltransferase
METAGKSNFDIAAARETLARRERERDEARHERWELATKDFKRIVDHIIQKYKPLRVYQWGSLLNKRHFTEISDIDIALEGLAGPLDGLDALADAVEMTDIPVDIVELERIHPLHARTIREEGVLIYERK